MKKDIIYKDMTQGPIEVCRDLCNRLMAHQADKGVINKEVLAAMNFDTRLKPSFEGADEKFLMVAFDGETAVGYIFAAAEIITEGAKNFRPNWGKDLPADCNGFYPDWLPTPVKIGSLNNLYVLPEYRGTGVGKHLADVAMDWMCNYPEVKYLFVHVSNGNDVVPFYEGYGFRHSHVVMGGIINAYYQENEKAGK